MAKLNGGLVCRRMVRVNGVLVLETATAAPQREICGEDRPLARLSQFGPDTTAKLLI